MWLHLHGSLVILRHVLVMKRDFENVMLLIDWLAEKEMPLARGIHGISRAR